MVRWEKGDAFKLSVTLPAGMHAQVQVPAGNKPADVLVGGKPVRAHRDGAWWILDEDIVGMVHIETRSTTFSGK